MSRSDRSTRELALIHIARQQLGMCDDSYRDILYHLCRVRSAKQLDAAGRRKVIDHLKTLGFTPVRRHQHRNPIKHRKGTTGDRLEKIQALLTVLGLEWAYADAIAKRMHRTDSVRFLPGDKQQHIIAALTVKAQQQLTAQLTTLLHQRQQDWAHAERLARRLGYTGRKLQSSVETLSRVIEQLSQEVAP